MKGEFKMKKTFTSLFLAMVMFVSISMNLGVSVNATSSTNEKTTISQTSLSASVVTPRADEYKYYYKFEGDYLWERKWNITRGYWMTEWYIIAEAQNN